MITPRKFKYMPPIVKEHCNWFDLWATPDPYPQPMVNCLYWSTLDDCSQLHRLDSTASNFSSLLTLCGTHNLAIITTRGSREVREAETGAFKSVRGHGSSCRRRSMELPFKLPIEIVIVLTIVIMLPSITRGVISVSRLFDDGFINRFDDNNVISVSKDNLVYFMAVPRDGIFKIDMSCSNTNDSSMYANTV
ncbi:hypothetical protein Tco_0156559 [Tanacetum coccineum]